MVQSVGGNPHSVWRH